MVNLSMNKDPVCGKNIDERTAKFKSIQAGNVYYFCSATCQEEFNKDSKKYLKQNPEMHHASHYSSYCPTPSCSAPARGPAWYFYVGLILLLLLLLLLIR